MLHRIATIGMIFFIAACQEESTSRWTPGTADVANQRERIFIQSVINDLQSYALKKNLAYDFRAVPIRVVNEFSYSFEDSEVGGACYPGDGKFIEIKRPVLRDLEEAWNILVHELGHCVLLKTHDDELMQGTNSETVVLRGRKRYPSADLTVSIMSSRGNRMAPKKYYLEELFGGERIIDLQILKQRYQTEVITVPSLSSPPLSGGRRRGKRRLLSRG